MTAAARRSVLSLTALLAVWGCQPRPRAPLLDNSPVYENRQEGFRFLVPAGWTQQIKGDLPPGKVEKERTLVQYRSFDPTPASFEVSRRDLPEDTDLGEFLSKRKRTGTGWARVGKPEPVEIGGRKGTRYLLQARPDDKPTACEVVVFRAGERVYFFAGFYPAGDTIRKSHVRQFLDGLQWTE